MIATAHGPSADEQTVLAALVTVGGHEPDRVADRLAATGGGAEARMDHALSSLRSRGHVAFNTDRGRWEATPDGFAAARRRARPVPLPPVVRASDLLPTLAA